MLDQVQVKEEDNHPHTQLPVIIDNFFESESIKSLAGGFLFKYIFTFFLSFCVHRFIVIFRYYEAFDGDRNALVGAYEEHANFSLSHIPTSQVPLQKLILTKLVLIIYLCSPKDVLNLLSVVTFLLLTLLWIGI